MRNAGCAERGRKRVCWRASLPALPFFLVSSFARRHSTCGCFGGRPPRAGFGSDFAHLIMPVCPGWVVSSPPPFFVPLLDPSLHSALHKRFPPILGEIEWEKKIAHTQGVSTVVGHEDGFPADAVPFELVPKSKAMVGHEGGRSEGARLEWEEWEGSWPDVPF